MRGAVVSTLSPSKASYLRTEFLERVAHELRGPVGVTSGALDEIELALGPEAGALEVYFVMARRGMRRVLRMADRLQRTALLEGGAIEWKKVPSDLRSLADEAVREAELLETRKRVRVEVSRCDEPCAVVIDPEWTRAAVAEVVGNAMRYATSNVRVQTSQSPTEAVITITDDGHGFTAPLRARFVPSTEKRGVGLSLPLVCDVLASQGGRIEIVRSATTPEAPGGGRVVLALPLAGARHP